MVQKYQALVYTVCHQLVPDVQEAQDLTQETFLAAWRAIDRCPPGFEKQWLARIAANKAKDYLRSAWVRKMNTPGDEVLALEGAPPRYAAGAASAGSAGRGRTYRDDLKPARALLHALPSGAAGAAHHGRSCKTVRPTAQNGGSTNLPRQKDAGAADPAKRPHTL